MTIREIPYGCQSRDIHATGGGDLQPRWPPNQQQRRKDKRVLKRLGGKLRRRAGDRQTSEEIGAAAED